MHVRYENVVSSLVPRPFNKDICKVWHTLQQYVGNCVLITEWRAQPTSYSEKVKLIISTWLPDSFSIIATSL